MEPDPLTPASRRVEAYLDQILAPLARRLSPFHQEELRRELREHLWARVDAYRELGQTEEEAVTEALRQFGGANDFTRQWRREWVNVPPKVTLREVGVATRLALPPSLLALLLACLPVLFVDWQFHTYGSNCWLNSHLKVFASVWMCLDFLIPSALGVAIGRRVGRTAPLILFAALAADCLLGGLVNFVGRYFWPMELFFSRPVGMITQLAAMWIPISCTTATLTGWWAQRSEARRLAGA